MSNQITTWYGRPITELDKDELIEVINHLGNELNDVNQDRSRWMNAADPVKYLMETQQRD
jgi:hypothetical protein